jgi:hypothetical protein
LAKAGAGFVFLGKDDGCHRSVTTIAIGKSIGERSLVADPDHPFAKAAFRN